MSDTRHQYKYGDDGSMKSFVLELVWGPDYPAQPPGKPRFNPCKEIWSKHGYRGSVFAEIFAAQGAPPVPLTPMAIGKNRQS